MSESMACVPRVDEQSDRHNRKQWMNSAPETATMATAMAYQYDPNNIDGRISSRAAMASKIPVIHFMNDS